ncbi:MAG: type II secretion system protein [Candidatus Zambryskibacteria bacterium]|nr:type II secretion system protein [Candidatus Zambryskibacteria bacterium]
MKKHKNRGFTLIELLVVIAIIGILSSVVLASLNTARGKGSNAAVKSNLNNVRAQAELWYDTKLGTYLGVCAAVATAGGIKTGVDAAGVAGGAAAACFDAAGAWAASAPLKVAEGASAYWCVDSTGQSKGEAAQVATTVCT